MKASKNLWLIQAKTVIQGSHKDSEDKVLSAQTHAQAVHPLMYLVLFFVFELSFENLSLPILRSDLCTFLN